MRHIEGAQAGKGRCARNPYGFLAELVGTPCSDFPANPCNGSLGIEPTEEIPPELITSIYYRCHDCGQPNGRHLSICMRQSEATFSP